MVYDALGDLPNALRLYRDALAPFRAIGNRNGEAAALNNIGKIVHDTADWQTSIDNLPKAAQIFESVSDMARQSTALRNIGQIHLQLGDIDKALESYRARCRCAAPPRTRRGKRRS